MTEASPRSAPRSFDLSMILGIAGTIAFYAVMWQPSMQGTLLHRYTTQHPVEYVIVMLTIWGLVDIVLKVLSFPVEMLAARFSLLPPREGREPLARIPELLAFVRSHPRHIVESRLGRRITQALEYAANHGAGEDYREHLKYLADKADDERYARYTLVRFIIGATPILGFLGTVVHFGTALSGISVDQMAERLTDVVSQMGQAFNTTTAALAASMGMMFALFLCERFESRLTNSIDRVAEHELLHRFVVQHESLTPFLSVVQSAHSEALSSLAATLDRQVDLWSQALDTYLQRGSSQWSEALQALQHKHTAIERGAEDRIAGLLDQLAERQAQHLLQLQRSAESFAPLRQDVQAVGRTLQEIAQGEGRLLELQTLLSNNLQLLNHSQQMDNVLHELSAAIHLLTARHRRDARPDGLAA
jgi:biopolymer transport protein ExbB/TolQ